MKTKIILLLLIFVTEYGYSQFFQLKREASDWPDKVLETDEFIYVTQLYWDTALDELDKITIQKFNKNGKQNSVLTVTGNKGGYELLATIDNCIMLIMTEGTQETPIIKAIKFDKYLNKIWEKVIPADNQKLSAAYKDIDGSICLVTYDSNYKSIIRKLNNEAEPIWQSEQINAYMKSIYKINDFYLGFGYQNFIKISNTFNKEFEISFPNRIQDIAITNQNIFISLNFRKVIYKYDFLGNFIDSMNYSSVILHLNNTQDNNLLVTLSSNKVIKYNKYGEVIWAIDGPNSSIWKMNRAFSLKDNTILFSIGSGTTYFVRATENGYYKFFDYYAGPESNGYNNSVTLRWFSTNIVKVDISYLDYSDDEFYFVKEYQTVSGVNSFQCDIPKNLKKILIKDSEYPDFVLSYGFSELEFGYPHFDFLSINNIRMWVSNDGIGSKSPYYNQVNNTLMTTWRSLNDSVKGFIFLDGLTWGGIVDGMIKVNGSWFESGLKAGNIINKQPVDPSIRNYAPFKIRKGWENLSEGIEKSNYKFCFNNWPVHSGADWIDKNEDKIFSSGIDEPLFLGDEVIYYVANDLDTSRVNYATGCDPIGLEFQTTLYGFDSTNFLSDVVFKKYVVINKSEKEIRDMYFCYFSDTELGNAADDYTGCDSSLNLGYMWNSDNYDEWGFGTNPPAAGHMIVQGPIVPSDENDKAKFRSKWIPGFRNLPLTTFGPDWNMEIDNSYEDAMGMYNYIYKGLNYNSRVPLDYINPYTGVRTLFPLSGDPESGTGWYEGDGWPGGVYRGERKYWLTSGPFTMSPSDTQEVVIAILVAQGSSHLNSVTKLKEKAQLVQNFYDNLTYSRNVNERPTTFELFQNYPNPFNTGTTIKFSLSEKSNVRIKIFDILGREVKTILNEEKVPWTYDIKFDANDLASGVYLYRLEAGSFIQTKKMILLK